MSKISAKNVETVLFDEDDLFDKKYIAETPSLLFNLALGGAIDAGISPGITFFAGASKTLKTILGLIAVKSYMDKFPESICLFYDFEGSPAKYWRAIGIDTKRVMKVAANNVEDFKFDLTKKLENSDKKDQIIVFVDSLGMVPSKKELQDALNENEAADMSRAKAIKSFFRIVTPLAVNKRVPVVIINHVVTAMDKYSTDEMGGGKGGIYAANTIIYTSKKKLRGDGENATEAGVLGHEFILRVGKSRTIKEDTKLPLAFRYGESMPDRYAGLYHLAIWTGDIFSPSKGWRTVRLIDPETGELVPDDQLPRYREADMIFNHELWEDIMFKKTAFLKNVAKKILLNPDEIAARDAELIEEVSKPIEDADEDEPVVENTETEEVDDDGET